MKKIYKLLGASIVALSFASNIQAAAEKKSPAPQTQQVQNSVSINDTLAIKFLGREMVVDKEGKALSMFKFNISNIGNQPITEIQWLGVYVNDRKVIYSQDMQINLQTPLQPRQEFNINLQIPFLQIEERFRSIFANNQSDIQVFPVDRKVKLLNKQILAD